METTDYVSYPLALKLKEAGFGEPCYAFYWTSDKSFKETSNRVHTNSRTCDSMVAAPTLYHAQKWLREVKYLCVTVYAQPYNGVPYYTGYILFNGEETEVLDNDGHWFDKYEEALSAGIEAGLELLEKEVEK